MSTHTDTLKDELKALYTNRENIEKEIEQHTQALPPRVGLDGLLVDSEGFPRADVDVHAVRSHRQKIISEFLF